MTLKNYFALTTPRPVEETANQETLTLALWRTKKMIKAV